MRFGVGVLISKAATNPGTVWLKCLIELIGMASCPPTSPVTTDVLLRACWATEETLQVGLAPTSAGEQTGTEH